MDKNINSTIDNKENYKLLEDIPGNTFSFTKYLNPLNDYFEDTGSVFLCGKTRFNCDKFHVKNDFVTQISCGDEHTGVVTGMN